MKYDDRSPMICGGSTVTKKTVMGAETASSIFPAEIIAKKDGEFFPSVVFT